MMLSSLRGASSSATAAAAVASRLSSRVASRSTAFFSSKASEAPVSKPAPSAKALEVAAIDKDHNDTQRHLEKEKSAVQKYSEALTKADPDMVFGVTIPEPDPKLPDAPEEISALDPAHMNQMPLNLEDGSPKVVTIRQDEQYWPRQSPLDKEMNWTISFQDTGEVAETWDNSLMGWVSSADPMAANMKLQMTFNTAADAMYFAKKRGWKYVVEEPIIRKGRDDDAQYQDNFLPQAVAGKVKKHKTDCDHWHRPQAGTSHYFRPLKYHGNGTVRQHGPNCESDVAPHVEGYYKIR